MDYKKIGFKCGLEIHNRLNTKTKLFCGCRPSFSEDRPFTFVKRKMRAVAGELGQVDAAALYEYLKDRVFNYSCYKEETCLVDIDEEPPHAMSKEALEIVLQIAKLLKADVPDEVHIMRKIVVDGSNVASFQRTAIVGMNGMLETSQGNVGIANISLEEESAVTVGQKGSEISYRLDRLGIPLVEIGTAPDIKSPEHAKEVAEKIGMIVRSTGKSQRGIGVTREDLNVSISKGARVEIKGVQELDMIPALIENEVKRQQAMIERGETPKEETRIAKEDGTTDYARPLPGGERMYPETDLETVVITREMLSKIPIPETWDEKSRRLSKVLPKDMADSIIRSEYLEAFENLSKTYDPVMVAGTITSTIKDLTRKGTDTGCIDEQMLNELFLSVKEGKISKEAIQTVLDISCNEKVPVAEAISRSGIKSMSESELRVIVKSILSQYPELMEQKKFSPLMGEVMKQVRGKISGELVSKVLREEMNI